jgi:type II secretory pathway pseudopilin PulG
MKREQRGFTLFGLVVALALIGAMSLAALNAGKLREQQIDLDHLNRMANMVGGSLDGYYQDNCLAAPFPQPTMNVLTNNGYIRHPRWLDYRQEYSFSVAIDNPRTPQVSYRVVYNAEDDSLASNIASKHPNAYSAGSQVTWQFKPTLNQSAERLRAQEVRRIFGSNPC